MKTHLKRFVILLLLFAALSTSDGFTSPNANVTVHFTGMSPHLNQNLYLRVVDTGSMEETGRVVHQVTTANFDITLDAVVPGGSYFVDFFADVNSNDLYDVPPIDHAWRLELNNAVGGDELNFAHNTNFTDIQWPNTSDVNELESIGLNNFQLFQNYPNPFNPSTKIRFSIPSKEFVTLKVFNVLGREVTTLVRNELDEGLYEVDFSSNGLTSGVYFYTISTKNFVQTRKMILTK
jgi:hypothetical protein